MERCSELLSSEHNSGTPPGHDGILRSYYSNRDVPLIGRARSILVLQGTPADGVTVLLANEPDFADSVADQAVDLQLAGHSHGGQA